MSLCFFWFRRDLRLEDNAGLHHALVTHTRVQPIFIFDTQILKKLNNKADPRITFIYDTVKKLKEDLQKMGSDLWVLHGEPTALWPKLLSKHRPEAVFANRDDEPDARLRDTHIDKICQAHNITLQTYKDQSLFDRDEILTGAQKPYTVFTPYKKRVLNVLAQQGIPTYPIQKYQSHFAKRQRLQAYLSLADLGFVRSSQTFPASKLNTNVLQHYDKTRDIPDLQHGTSHQSLHLRFGTTSVRKLANLSLGLSPVYLSELIWRDFFKQILWHFPRVVGACYHAQYDTVAWRQVPSDLQRWQAGQTGYPLVDAGMRQLNQTGWMHNRVRMVVASFLCKHLLLYWLEGERYFAEKLLDYDLSANNGNWQWAAGTGCDAAPYFRILNPQLQQKRFDSKFDYIKRWVPEFDTHKYAQPMIEHTFARQRALDVYGQIQSH